MKPMHAVYLGCVAAALSVSAPVLADTSAKRNDGCAVASGGSSTSSSASAAGAGPSGARADCAVGPDRTAGQAPGRDCARAGTHPSSTVTIGPEGLRGSTTMPDGSSVAVQPDRAARSTGSTASAASSGTATASSSASAAASGADGECATGASPTHRQPDGRPARTKEN